MKTTKFWTILLAGVAVAAMPFAASAQEEGTKAGRELRAAYDKALQGKTIAYLPIALGVPLADEWGRVLQEEAEWRGMKYSVRPMGRSSRPTTETARAATMAPTMRAVLLRRSRPTRTSA